MNKLIVKPVEVPWMISVSDEFIGFSGNEETVNLRIACQYSPKIREGIISGIGKKYGKNIPDELYNSAGSAIIEVKFKPIYFFSQWVKVEGYEKFDFSCLDPYYFGDLSITNEWNVTNICPDPNFYEVVESNLKEYLGIKAERVKHWLLSSHDSYINILADGFEWNAIKESRI